MSTFKLNDLTFNEGDVLTVTMPELGTFEVETAIRPFSQGHVLGLDLGWIKTPEPCQATNEPGVNAKLSFYTNGMGYTNLQCAYLCPCGQNAHPRSYEWDNLEIVGNRISAGPARQEKKRIPAPITPPPPTVIARPQIAYPPKPTPSPKKAAKKPDSKASNDGQFKLF